MMCDISTTLLLANCSTSTISWFVGLPSSQFLFQSWVDNSPHIHIYQLLNYTYFPVDTAHLVCLILVSRTLGQADEFHSALARTHVVVRDQPAGNDILAGFAEKILKILLNWM